MMKTKNWFIALLALMFLVTTQPVGASAESYSSGTGSKLLIYYATPKLINNVRDDAAAAAIFAKYDYVVLGAGLESPSHAYNVSTRNIIGLAKSIHPSMKFFGYVDLGVTTYNYTIDVMQTKVTQWKSMGVSGIFLDDAGYDFQTPRARLNLMLDYLHSNQLSGFVNAWKPEDVMGSEVNAAYNPSGIATRMGPNDYYLLESFILNTVTSSSTYVSNSGYAIGKYIKQRGDKAMNYKKTLGVKMMAINVVDYVTRTDAQIRKYFEMMEVGSLLFGLDGYGLSAANYSASGTNRFLVKDHAYNPNYKTLVSSSSSYTTNATLTEFKRAGYTIHNEPSSHWWNFRQ
ncbi:hypothetical protein ACFFSY_08145 [Paenibacillus aurantiacus]|uniref:Glycoside-hydrolase family GH114 TIM-barrel domain-containing protein n=1 Tax=Paenibacillus aurantiacus TaxID=1936118 RepID=A0ABV5KP50_9BACL